MAVRVVSACSPLNTGRQSYTFIMVIRICIPVLALLVAWTPWVAVAQGSKQAPPVPGMPKVEGVYYRQGPDKWIKLDGAPPHSSRMGGLDAYLQTDGLTNLDVNYVYPGSRATFQITDPRPTFYVRGVAPAQDALVVRLTRKKDSRTVQTESSASMVGNKGGFKKGAVRTVTVVSYSDGSSSITPDEELKPGEYLLAFGYATLGFDFGISQAKKRD